MFDRLSRHSSLYRIPAISIALVYRGSINYVDEQRIVFSPSCPGSNFTRCSTAADAVVAYHVWRPIFAWPYKSILCTHFLSSAIRIANAFYWGPA